MFYTDVASKLKESVQNLDKFIARSEDYFRKGIIDFSLLPFVYYEYVTVKDQAFNTKYGSSTKRTFQQRRKCITNFEDFEEKYLIFKNFRKPYCRGKERVKKQYNNAIVKPYERMHRTDEADALLLQNDCLYVKKSKEIDPIKQTSQYRKYLWGKYEIGR